MNKIRAGDLKPGDLIDATPFMDPGFTATGVVVDADVYGESLPGKMALAFRFLEIDGELTDRWGAPYSHGIHLSLAHDANDRLELLDPLEVAS